VSELIEESSDIDTRHSYISQNTDAFESIYNNVRTQCTPKHLSYPSFTDKSQISSASEIRWLLAGRRSTEGLSQEQLKQMVEGTVKEVIGKSVNQGNK